MTQQQLADQLGLAQQTLAHYEVGREGDAKRRPKHPGQALDMFDGGTAVAAGLVWSDRRLWPPKQAGSNHTMRAYLNAIFNHFRVLQSWAAQTDAKLTLDLRTFELEVKCRSRYYSMYPMFQSRVDDRLAHSSALPQELIGFGGWRPYHSLRHPCSTDKRLFKAFLAESGLPSPASLSPQRDAGPPPFDYLLKAAVGSFGREIVGPFRAGTLPDARQEIKNRGQPDSVFIEQFIEGTILKIWFWGERAFFAHMNDYPVIVGDGESGVEALVRDRVAQGDKPWEHWPDRDLVTQCLDFQGTDFSQVLETGQRRWIDYRYGQRYERTQGFTPQSDTALPDLINITGDQIAAMGKALANLLRQTFPAPVMISVDGMLDHRGMIWWLEMNTNSLVPPEAYAAMFADLFQ